VNPEIQQAIGQRLKCVQGHIQGVCLMIEEERPVPEVIQQLEAIQGSLRMIRKLLLNEHLQACLQDHESLTLASQTGLQELLDHILDQDKS